MHKKCLVKKKSSTEAPVKQLAPTSTVEALIEIAKQTIDNRCLNFAPSHKKIFREPLKNFLSFMAQLKATILKMTFSGYQIFELIFLRSFSG